MGVAQYLWVKFSCTSFKPRSPQKFCLSKITRYTVYITNEQSVHRACTPSPSHLPGFMWLITISIFPLLTSLFGLLFLPLLSLHWLADVSHKLLVLDRHKAGHHLIAKLPHQSLQDVSGLGPEVTAVVITPWRDTAHLYIEEGSWNWCVVKRKLPMHVTWPSPSTKGYNGRLEHKPYSIPSA